MESVDPTIIALQQVYDRIIAQANKFSEPEEREYRAGMRDGAAVVQHYMMELNRART